MRDGIVNGNQMRPRAASPACQARALEGIGNCENSRDRAPV